MHFQRLRLLAEYSPLSYAEHWANEAKTGVTPKSQTIMNIGRDVLPTATHLMYIDRQHFNLLIRQTIAPGRHFSTDTV